MFLDNIGFNQLLYSFSKLNILHTYLKFCCHSKSSHAWDFLQAHQIEGLWRQHSLHSGFCLTDTIQNETALDMHPCAMEIVVYSNNEQGTLLEY